MTYTHGHHESVLRSHKWRTVDNSAAYLAPRLTSGSSVLDLGCGPGTITADIGRRVAPGRVLGIDASADVIEAARREAGGGPNVEFSVADLYSLDTDGEMFERRARASSAPASRRPRGRAARDEARVQAGRAGRGARR
jgi:ubiquinone/menaquinone biosynthesis C-methylase UbiE